ncbi:xylanase [Algoriphagus halophytocola]|uniref:Xylanase n=1 Tax=Algoriphagus halophytocola TaxID=2991499 RepID=A0ABY6MJ80_9BACT|nr:MULTISPECIES: glycoside hydrolase [unclassified Algoriphagus]UZD23218.1 xylanase [Algoriphagus sp. TR-M5]WBL44511.1 xylanase [Algoriphagus sp. TR-M9]
MSHSSFPRFILLSLLALLMAGHSSGQERQGLYTTSVPLKIDAIRTEKFQVIEHFGASDAWSAQFVGGWPEEKKNAIAELLFSQENDTEGIPKGIGLSLWRFNIGAGSAQQGGFSGIRDEWRRAETFLEADGTYNWDKQAGQLWFAKAAQELGVERLLVFPNSPPVSMTKNGKAHASDGKSNLAEDDFPEFAEYLAEVIEGLQRKGLDVDYVSPVNEPQWDWSESGQEGTPFWNHEIAGIVRALDAALSRRNLKTKIDVAEAGKINYLYEQADREGRGAQIKEFFHPESKNYLGDLTHVSSSISGHSYFTTSPFELSAQQRRQLDSALTSVPGLRFWMSEYCILGDNAGEINGYGRDLGMESALYLARVIHNDLTISNASAWHWWLAISPYDYKDGLIYIDKQKNDGDFYESKMLWALGNFSRFIRPGYQRVGVEINGVIGQNKGFLVSAYESPAANELVFVLVNSGLDDISVDLNASGAGVSIQALYYTSEDRSLEPESTLDSGSLSIPARSIVTVKTML